MIQSSSMDRYLSTYRSPSMITSSNGDPDRDSACLSIDSRCAAPASSSSTELATGRPVRVLGMSRLLHLREQARRPSSPAERGVGSDPVVLDTQDVRLVAGVRNALLGPGQHELDQLASREGGAADLFEAALLGEPARQRGVDLL